MMNDDDNYKKIALIIPYFGNFKNYFQVFLTSCKNNPTIDWLIYTDSIEAYEWPENVHKITTTFEDFKQRIQANFDFCVCLDKPYKLCDFKPTYGEVLANDLKDYDFWGYCDCDLIFGDIRKFLTDDVLGKYEKIFTRGHLSIYHNDAATNAFYRTQTNYDYKKVLTTPQAWAFDEWGGVSSAWDKSGRVYYDELCMDDIMYTLDGFHPTKSIRGYGNPYHKNNVNQASKYRKMRNVVYAYENGKLFRCWNAHGEINKEEVLYVHFQKRNMNVDLQQEEENSFLIVPDRFVDYKDLTQQLMKQLAPNKITSKNIIESTKQVIRNIVK